MGRYLEKFDRVIDRKNTGSLKYDFGPIRKGRGDLLPLWVADMDFAVPDEVTQAIMERTEHGIFGYTEPDASYLEALADWYRVQHGWEICQEWNTVTPGVVYAIAVAVRALTEPGDSVLIQQPVYYPFSEVIRDNGRKLVNNELILAGGRYVVDLEDFEKKITDNHVKLFLLCSPHNPVGRVWTREELLAMGDICRKHGVTVFSDEIHADFVYRGRKHIPFASLGEEYADICITGTSASKTFNLAGLQVSNILIANPGLRRTFRKENGAGGYSQANTLGLAATGAAYRYGHEWHEDLLTYLEGNLAYIRDYLAEHIPDIRLVEPEGTYLIWLDCTELFDTGKELKAFFEDEAHIWGDEGAIFGEASAQFERLNIAAPRRVIRQAMKQIDEALQARR